MTAGFRDPLVRRITAFLGEIGLAAELNDFADATFLPGIKVAQGVIFVNEERLAHPGDLLHEAGHLAVVPREQRLRLGDNMESTPAEEMMAIAWSWAALKHLRLDPAVVFHPAGYRGHSAGIIEAFSAGRYFGVPMLQWVGMTFDNPQARERGVEPYPWMVKWLRE